MDHTSEDSLRNGTIHFTADDADADAAADDADDGPDMMDDDDALVRYGTVRYGTVRVAALPDNDGALMWWA